MTPLAGLITLPVSGSPGVALSSLPAAAAWPGVAVLGALALRSAARLAADRAPSDPSLPGCSLTSRTGDAIHLAMAVGMIPMLVPLGVPPTALVVLFSATTAWVAATWLRRMARRRLAVRRGGVAPCRPAPALEPHHVIIGLAMIVMAWRMTDGADMAAAAMPGAATAAMPGMAASPGWPAVSTLALIYTWTAVAFLGGGLAKAASAQPLPTGTVALLAAPVTVYTCELSMTVVTGLMLLG